MYLSIPLTGRLNTLPVSVASRAGQMQAMLRKHLTIVCRHLPLPHLVVSIPAEHQPKEAVAVVADPTVGREDSHCFKCADIAVWR